MPASPPISTVAGVPPRARAHDSPSAATSASRPTSTGLTADIPPACPVPGAASSSASRHPWPVGGLLAWTGLEGEAIAHARRRGDHRRVAELAPQAADRDRDRVGERVGELVPDLLEQLLGAEEGRPRAQQGLEHPELLDREIHRPPVP